MNSRSAQSPTRWPLLLLYVFMKSKFLFSVFLALCSSEIYCQTYRLKSCKIDFEYSTPMFKGKKTLIFTDSGKIEKLVTEQVNDTLKMQELIPGNMGRRSKGHMLQIQTKDSIFSVDLDLMVGSSRKRIGLGIDMSSLLAEQNKNTQQDTFLNRKCDIVDFNGLRMWYWKGIILKKQLPEESGGIVLESATSIDENYAIKEDEFKVPAGVKMK